MNIKPTEKSRIMKKAQVKLTAALLATLLLVNTATSQGIGGKSAVTLESLLKEMLDRDATARWPAPEFVSRQAGSYDRRKKTPGDPDGWFANNDYSIFIRSERQQDRTEWVMLDADEARRPVPAASEVLAPKTTVPVDNPIPHAAGWFAQCEARIAAAKGKPIDIMFIGDSLTQNFIESPTDKWKLVGIDVWKKHFAERRSLNFGVGSDGTQHVLWRLEHMDVAGFTPKVIVLEIGVNNMFSPAAEIVAGTRAVLDKLRAMYPAARIVLMAILPNGRNWQRTQEVNAATRSFADNKVVFYLDLAPDMPLEKGRFRGVGGDAVHLTPEGYEIWASHLDPLLDKLLSKP